MIPVLVFIALVVFGVVALASKIRSTPRTTAADKRRDELKLLGFVACPEQHAEVEQRYNSLTTTSGHGGYTIRNPYCIGVAGQQVFFFTSVPPPYVARGAGIAPRPAFLLRFSAPAGRAQVWLTNKTVEANPALAQKIRQAYHTMANEAAASSLVTLDVPRDWAARGVVGAIGEAGHTLDSLLGDRSGDMLAGAAERGLFEAVFGGGWVALEHFPFLDAMPTPRGSLGRQVAFVRGLAAGSRR